MNVFVFSGNLGKDARLESTQGGTPIARFSVAVTSGYGDKKKTTWVSCGLFGKRAESLAPYLLKGQQVVVSGEASLNEWEKDGQNHAQLSVNVNDVTLVGGKATMAPNQAPGQQTSGPAAPVSGPTDFADDSDLPF